MANIYIFSEPAQSGKTAAVENWLSKRQGVSGLLTPEVLGKKKLYDIATGDYFDFEVDEYACDDSLELDGHFFDSTVFARGREILKSATEAWPRWLVVDEVSRLEVDGGNGWEPTLGEIINAHNDVEGDHDMLLVLRDDLLNEAIQHYRLHAAIVLDKKFFSR